MSKLIIDGKPIGGTSNRAAAVKFDDTYIKQMAQQAGLDVSMINVDNVQNAINSCFDGIGALMSSITVKEVVIDNVNITTKSSNGAYYGTVINYEDLGVSYSRILSIVPLNWAGATAPYNLYLHYSQGINAMSEISQTVGSIGVRVFYSTM